MINGETKSGFAFQIDEDNLDDFELIELLADADGGNVNALIKGMSAILGKDQVNAMKEHVREKSGKVRASAMTELFSDIMTSANETKNS